MELETEEWELNWNVGKGTDVYFWRRKKMQGFVIFFNVHTIRPTTAQTNVKR